MNLGQSRSTWVTSSVFSWKRKRSDNSPERNDMGQNREIFHLILIKPSHYDDDGYVIQWMRSSIPSNSLAVLYGLGLDCAEREVLGAEVEIRLEAFDETNTRVPVERLKREICARGHRGMVALCGVQTNQYPRALDIARRFREEKVPVCIGGFHVSGSIAMLPGIQPDLQQAIDDGISLFAGELEGRFDEVLRDAYENELKPLYNFMNDLPDLDGSPLPWLPAEMLARTSGTRTSFDAGRGCPFQCSFCTIINVQGRKSRVRSVDEIEKVIGENAAQGVTNFFISDDNFARNSNWESIYDRLIFLREVKKIPMRFTIQVDTLSHRLEGFIEKSARAGVTRVFIGMESINPETLRAAGKRQNRIGEYRNLLEAWHNAGVLTYAGYILGFPADTPDSIRRDIRTIQETLPIDILEFFILTPLPGSEDHQRLFNQGVEMDGDQNNYDVVHVTTDHPRMSRDELKAIYREAWNLYYTPEHVYRVISRAVRWGFPPAEMMLKLLSFYAVPLVEKVHPLEGGVFRRKYRCDRRPHLPRENPLVFYSRYFTESIVKVVKFAYLYWKFKRIRDRAIRESSLEQEFSIAARADRVLR